MPEDYRDRPVPGKARKWQTLLIHILACSTNTTALQLGKVTTAMFFLYYFFYGTSFAKVPWVYNSEVNSLGWRTRGAAAATATNWICGFIVTQFTKVGVNNLKWKFYLSMFPFSHQAIQAPADLPNSSLCHPLLGLLPRRLRLVPRDLAPHARGHG